MVMRPMARKDRVSLSFPLFARMLLASSMSDVVKGGGASPPTPAGPPPPRCDDATFASLVASYGLLERHRHMADFLTGLGCSPDELKRMAKKCRQLFGPLPFPRY